jgi:hypothetical protein
MSASPDPSLIRSPAGNRSPAGGSPAGGDPVADLSRRLVALAEVLEAAHHRSPDRRASLVLVRGLATDAYELAVRPIDDGDVHGALLATTVASEYDAAGFVVRGRAHSLSGPDGIDHPVAVLGRACVAVMASRDGTVASVVRIDDAEPMVQVDTDAAGSPAPGSGRLLDALRRSMGLPTPPPPGPVDALAAGLWLHRILERAVDAAPVDLDAVDDLFPDLGSSWGDLRRERALGCWPELGVAPDLAD